MKSYIETIKDLARALLVISVSMFIIACDKPYGTQRDPEQPRTQGQLPH